MAVNDFEDWLCKKLTSLDIDNDIYGSYITGILLETDDEEEKNVALSEVLSSVGVDNSEELCSDLIKMWKSFQADINEATESSESAKNIGDIFAVHIPKPSKTTISKSEISKDMSSVKRAVLARYGEVNDEDHNQAIAQFETNEPDLAPRSNKVDSALEMMKNTNAENITQAEKLERLKRKEEAVKKKEQDKVDREHQKTKKAERKDKEKKRTQKKERGR